MIKKESKKHTYYIPLKKILILLSCFLNTLFFIRYDKKFNIIDKNNTILTLFFFFSFVFTLYLIHETSKERKNKKKNEGNSNCFISEYDLISFIYNFYIIFNLFNIIVYFINYFDFTEQYRGFLISFTLIISIVLFSFIFFAFIFKSLNVKSSTIISIVFLIYFIGIFDLNEVYFGTAFSILLTSIASLDQLKNIGSYLRQIRVNFEITQWINSLTEGGLSEDELNGKIELIKISIILLLLGFLTIIKLTEIKIKDCKNIVEIILYFFAKQNIDLQVNKLTMVIYTGIIRIIMVGILFIFLCLFKKTRTFIKIVFNTNNKATELWDKGIINIFEVGTYRGLKQIHKYLYRDIYEFAGKTRGVNLAKGNFRFTNILYLESNLAIIEKMPEGSFDEIIEKYVEMNVAHPFREGNGRATRIWLDLMLKKNLNKCIDWTMVDRADYLSAMERSPVNSLEIKHLLKNALTDKVDDRGVYLRGIQQSYVYEDLDRYDIEDIEE